MKYTYFCLLALLTVFACQSPQSKDTDTAKLISRIDSLEKQVQNSYKPGFGEFMSSIQVHHEKLWFAGINADWELADFEITEIKEAVGDIEKFNADRPESKDVNMLYPVLDSLSHSISQQDVPAFKASFTTLTQTCNSCHRITDHAFNVITIPSTPPFSNQKF